ncbi:leucine-rich repeats of kinetochore protein cenp-F/LEK1 domain-containing protein [Pochonia chlamydosporia 170]|uniref:Leucine-rich repeats of kinetochore protein cenp-F/LEK1 domain-containing protein n=1 Tax=Pochonia chlamydosporia 170 TaxID=1380566 RepID=A0A179F770_METCM|nr:leucine-rich repeats of kinetochore protein cenp-F/LEK1 domain-containing protein [Pochonia chlamydosporia 170]OAQ61003.1 leucine-rich repeats of kinetochore protein cenp-F/LEK1 domain-containing protein [Pochonia chlamydosporia 170]
MSGAVGTPPSPSPSRRRVSLSIPTDENPRTSAAYEYDDEVPARTQYNTELNKARDECDRYKVLLDQAYAEIDRYKKLLEQPYGECDRCKKVAEQANKKLLEEQKKQDGLTLRLATCEEENAVLVRELRQSRNETAELQELNYVLEASLGGAGGVPPAAPSPAFVGATTVLPERTKSSHKSSKKEHREERGHKKDKSREMKEQKAEKERLKGRFEEKPTSASASNGQRLNFIEGWGSRLGAGAGVPVPGASPMQPTVRPNRISSTQVPAMSRGFKDVAYSTVPRTAGRPMSSGMYGAGHGASYPPASEDDYENGNYQPFPMTR